MLFHPLLDLSTAALFRRQSQGKIRLLLYSFCYEYQCIIMNSMHFRED